MAPEDARRRLGQFVLVVGAAYCIGELFLLLRSIAWCQYYTARHLRRIADAQQAILAYEYDDAARLKEEARQGKETEVPIAPLAETDHSRKDEVEADDVES